METRGPYIVVGAIVLILTAAAFLFVLFLSQSNQDYDEYDIVFRERVSGLSVGAAVSFNGIQKGEVMELTISPDDPSIVIARIRVDDDTPVRTDTKAELELVGFTGLAIIQLVGGGANKPLLKAVARGIPRIEADTSGIAQLISGSSDIIAAANKFLTDENTKAVADILANVSTVTASLAKQSGNIEITVANAAKASENLATASAKLGRTLDNLDRLTGPETVGAVADARKTLQETEALVVELKGAVAENRAAVRAFTDQGLAEIGPAVAEARAMFRSLDQVLREIDRDPRGYLLGESAPLYEGKK